MRRIIYISIIITIAYGCGIRLEESTSYDPGTVSRFVDVNSAKYKEEVELEERGVLVDDFSSGTVFWGPTGSGMLVENEKLLIPFNDNTANKSRNLNFSININELPYVKFTASLKEGSPNAKVTVGLIDKEAGTDGLNYSNESNTVQIKSAKEKEFVVSFYEFQDLDNADRINGIMFSILGEGSGNLLIDDVQFVSHTHVSSIVKTKK